MSGNARGGAGRAQAFAFREAKCLRHSDGNTFTVDVPFESDPADRGVWSVRSGTIAGYEGTADGSSGIKITSPNHGLDNGQSIEIRDAGNASYNGLKTITRIDANSFSITQAFAGDPAVKGTWDVPVAITGLQPPADLPVLVTSTGHRLSSVRIHMG